MRLAPPDIIADSLTKFLLKLKSLLIFAIEAIKRKKFGLSRVDISKITATFINAVDQNRHSLIFRSIEFENLEEKNILARSFK